MIARIIEVCARQRFLVFLSTTLAAIAALFALRETPLDAIPDLSDPQVIVYAEWMGRGPTLVEEQVTAPLVAALAGTPRVASVRGSSMFGMTFIYVLFEEGTDAYWARSRVAELLATVRGRLPEGVAPTLGPDASSVGWAFQYALVDKSGRMDLAALRTYQDFTLRPALASVAGVAEVASVGGYEKQYQATVDPERLRAFGLTFAQVAAAVRRTSAEGGGHVIERARREYYVRGRAYLQDLPSLAKTVVGTRASSTGTPLPILLSDVGRVAFGSEPRRGVGELDGEGEAVGAVVVVRYGQNVHTVIERVKAKVASLAPSLPPGVLLRVVYDRTQLIERAVDTLWKTLLEEGVVVALIILLFLLHLPSALLPIMVLPLGVAMAFIPMRALGLTANIMSLGGIAIAIGAMVDAAIVVVENAHKHMERLPPGAPRESALLAAAKEVGPAIFFSLLIVTVAFLPVFALEGQAGRLFKPLAYTKTFAMLSAAILSITLVPPLLRVLVRGRIRAEARHPVSRFVIALYKPFVFVALRNPKTTVAMGLLAVLSAAPLYFELGVEFMPPLNEGDLLYMPTTLPSIGIDEAKRSLQIQDRILRSFPEVETVFGKAGRMDTATDPAPLSMIETVVKLKPRAAWRRKKRSRWWSSWAPEWLASALRALWPDERPWSSAELTAEMTRALRLSGWTQSLTMPIKTRIDMLTTGLRASVGLKVLGNDLGTIERVGHALEALLARVPGTRSALFERMTGGAYIDVVPDRDALARHGLTAADIVDLVESAVGGKPIAFTLEGRKRLTINVRYPRAIRSSVERLREILVPLPASTLGPANALPTVPMMEATTGSMDAAPAAVDAMSAMGAAPAKGPMAALPTHAFSPPSPTQGLAYVRLGSLANVQVTSGPPMLRSEGGRLVGYVYLDVDSKQRSLDEYVEDAKRQVNEALATGRLSLTGGHAQHSESAALEWVGQYEELRRVEDRLRFVIPVALLLIAALLFLQFRNLVEVLIVLLSIPFALVGSVWLMWLLDYRFSTAAWVGIIALVGLAAQTGIVMIVYLDRAYAQRKAAGLIRGLDDIVAAHMEGTVQRVRPKLMTILTTLLGLLPLLASTGAGADVMRRMAAPMIGGLLTSAFLTLEVIPVVYTYWRLAQLRRDQRQAPPRG